VCGRLFACRKRGANLIVMGTHGRSGLARMLFGSVTASVLEQTKVPVAVVTHWRLVHVIVDRQRRSGAGVVVLGRDVGSPGHVAFQLLDKTRAVVVFVP
jgi:hypothetical protein